MLLTYLAENCCELPAGARKPLWRFLHYLFRRFDPDHSTVFLNYGFAHPQGTSPTLDLNPEEEKDRNAIQLYHQVTHDVPLENAAVLEVGCGRGGGALFLTRHRRPSEYVGLDISAATTAFCNRFHRAPGLSFVQGEAERLPFSPGRFDVVVNIESARCYGDLDVFFRGVFRVLKPGGHFLFADVLKRGSVAGTSGLLRDAGFVTLRASDIRQNVIRAMRQDSSSRRVLIESRVPRFMRQGFYEVSSTTNSRRFRSFVNGEFTYWSFHLRKPETPGQCPPPVRDGEGGGAP
jgi:ubiquinone/menaquinone biosynthesis C-methylase UbiE